MARKKRRPGSSVGPAPNDHPEQRRIPDRLPEILYREFPVLAGELKHVIRLETERDVARGATRPFTPSPTSPRPGGLPKPRLSGARGAVARRQTSDPDGRFGDVLRRWVAFWVAAAVSAPWIAYACLCSPRPRTGRQIRETVTPDSVLEWLGKP